MKRITETAITNLLLTLMLLILIFSSFSSVPASAVTAPKTPVYCVDTEEKAAALMFNVYQGANYLPGLLAVLDREKVPGTFFIGGTFAFSDASSVRLIASMGHEIGNHGYHHRMHTQLTLEQGKEEIRRTNELLSGLTGKTPVLFAPPSGDVNDNVVRQAFECGCRTVMWTADTIDWRDQDVEKIFQRVVRKTQPGMLILMHPTEATVQMLPDLIKHLKSEGYSFFTVSGLIALENNNFTENKE